MEKRGTFGGVGERGWGLRGRDRWRVEGDATAEDEEKVLYRVTGVQVLREEQVPTRKDAHHTR